MTELVGRSITLRQIVKSDLPTLFAWRNEYGFISLCSTRRNTVTLEQFEQEITRDLNNDRHLQCLILKKGLPIGTIFAYGHNATDGFIYVTTYLAPGHKKLGYGAQAFALFVDHLFNTLNLFKIYTDVYSYNLASLSSLLNGGFVEEGRFRGHRLLENQRHDLLRLAFFADQLPHLHTLIEHLKK